MRTLASYFRIILFLTISFVVFYYIGKSEGKSVYELEPLTWVIWACISLFYIAGEICFESLKSILYQSMTDEAKAKYHENMALVKANRFKWIKENYSKLKGGKPLEEEHEIILDHNYDGIKELDNKLPPWWIYLFYITIVFAAVYLIRFEVFNDYNQIEEYELAVAEAKAEIAAWKITAKNLVDVNTVTALTDPSDLKAGKTIFTTNCVVCHKDDGGGGIGPNLTDQYWILGGGIKNIFSTISNGGRDGKGMISWKNELKPLEMAQVSSYILTLNGTTPAEPKAPEGEIWINLEASKTEVKQETENAKDLSDDERIDN